MEWFRFGMFFTISLLVVFVAQSIGLMIGAWFNVVVRSRLSYTVEQIEMLVFIISRMELSLHQQCRFL